MDPTRVDECDPRAWRRFGRRARNRMMLVRFGRTRSNLLRLRELSILLPPKAWTKRTSFGCVLRATTPQNGIRNREEPRCVGHPAYKDLEKISSKSFSFLVLRGLLRSQVRNGLVAGSCRLWSEFAAANGILRRRKLAPEGPTSTR